MDLHQAIHQRRTIQRFAPGAVPREAIDRALAAAVMAPNHKTTWPFRFVLPGPAARQALFAVGLRLKVAKKGGHSASLEAAVRADMLAPDKLVAVVQVVDPDANRAEEDYAACACAAYALQLSLFDQGYATKWGTGGTLRDPVTRDVLGLAERERIIAFVWVGRADITPQPPMRPPLETLVRTVP